MKEENIPTVGAIITRNISFENSVLLEVICPYCGKDHTHGMSDYKEGMNDFGHRIPHCDNLKSNNGYYIVRDKRNKLFNGLD